MHKSTRQKHDWTQDLGLLRKELLLLAGIALAVIVALQLVYIRESFLTLVRAGGAILWLFLLPGYFMLWYWRHELEFIERAIYGAVAGLAIMGTLSYFAGLLGLHVVTHHLVFPPLVVILGFVLGQSGKERAPSPPERHEGHQAHAPGEGS